MFLDVLVSRTVSGCWETFLFGPNIIDIYIVVSSIYLMSQVVGQLKQWLELTQATILNLDKSPVVTI